MTYQPNCTLPEEILEQITTDGLEALPELIRVLINEAMRLEREQYLGARYYERSPERQGYANGYREACLWQSSRQSRPGWARSSSRCRRFGRDTFTRMLWRKGCEAKER